MIEVTGPQAPLIEMTGQHDNRNLLSKSYHLDLLDMYAGLWEKRSVYELQFTEWMNLKQQIIDFEKKSLEKNQRIDFLKYQVSELKSLNLDPETDANLEQEIKTLKNSSKLIQFADFCDQVIYHDDDSVSARLKSILKKSVEAAAVDQNIADKVQTLSQAQSLIDESLFELRQYVQKINLDPEILEEKESRLSQIRKLQKKHGENLSDLLQTFEKLQSELNALENSDNHLQDLKKKCSVIELDLNKKADDLHSARANQAKKLTKQVNEELLDLNMKGVTFDIQINRLNELNLTGNSDVEFLSQTSPKDPKRPISKVASGGELSRILLALKKSVGAANNKNDWPRTYLFDEVDTGVSGTTAEKVGRKLKEIAKGQQVICVTHLPQVAAFGDVHFTISKSTQKQQAVMTVTVLNQKERVEEIARLISGEKISKTSLAHAEQLLSEV